jgi:hypothetical protein
MKHETAVQTVTLPPAKPATPGLQDPDTSSEAILYLPGHYYSRLDGTGKVRVFNFPQKVNLGPLYMWSPDGKLHTAKALGTVQVPLGDTTILEMGGSLAFEPSLSTHFQDGDLDGLIIDCTEVGQAEDDLIEQSANAIMGFKSIRTISFNRTHLSDSSFDRLDYLPNVRWLCLWNAGESGARIAKINLSQLRVLGVDDIDSMTPILQRLNKSLLQRLCLQQASMTEADWSSLSQMSALDTLDLAIQANWRKFTLESEKERRHQFECISKLRKLRRLSLNGSQIGLPSDQAPRYVLAALKQLPELKQLYVQGTTPFQLKKLKETLPHCQVIDHNDRETINYWFDPRYEDPTGAVK